MVIINPQHVNYFPRNLKFLIKKFDTNQQELALYVNKNQTSISNWINKISQPDIEVMIKIHEYFGISIDLLVFVDLENGKIIPDSHVQEFKRNGKVNGKISGKIQAYSSEYFKVGKRDEVGGNVPDSTAAWAMMGQFKQVNEKLDGLRVLSEEILKKNPK